MNGSFLLGLWGALWPGIVALLACTMIARLANAVAEALAQPAAEAPRTFDLQLIDELYAELYGAIEACQAAAKAWLVIATTPPSSRFTHLRDTIEEMEKVFRPVGGPRPTEMMHRILLRGRLVLKTYADLVGHMQRAPVGGDPPGEAYLMEGATLCHRIDEMVTALCQLIDEERKRTTLARAASRADRLAA